jgi:hypothetical protein
MKLRLVLIMVPTLVLVLSASSVGAAPSTLIIGKGQSASAVFSTVSGDGCTQIDVTLFAVEGTEHSPPGPPEVLAFASVNINTSSLCGPAPGLSASGDIQNPDFTVDRRLNTATLHASVPVSGDLPISSVDINMNWTGIGDLIRSHSHEVFSGPDFTAIFNGTGTFRHAQVFGSISDGTTNFTPEPSTSGALTSGHFIELQFEH